MEASGRHKSNQSLVEALFDALLPCSPATYEVYGATINDITANDAIAHYLRDRTNVWKSPSDSGARGVKVTFKEKVSITRFEGPYFEFI